MLSSGLTKMFTGYLVGGSHLTGGHFRGTNPKKMWITMWKSFDQIIRIYGLYYFTLYCC
jgi:hypothetical protein